MLRNYIYRMEQPFIQFFDQLFKNAHVWHYNQTYLNKGVLKR
ncbi:hypothetical protein HPHPA26_0831 [Helicobacter pylori Hp A-26]|uniref:Uncharacterized protein n=1 Tax=Helicobacter pylori Hp A-26 TaxID=992056 RepID=J0CT49_HELPX|nr:hypothetical protein HPHPA26_0831 [Helicobacter pylori Hp A-26]